MVSRYPSEPGNDRHLQVSTDILALDLRNPSHLSSSGFNAHAFNRSAAKIKIVMMAGKMMLSQLLLCYLVSVATSFEWPKQYTAEGTIYLPYAEIAEPFKAVVDMTKGMSRIDTYDGRYNVQNSMGLELSMRSVV